MAVLHSVCGLSSRYCSRVFGLNPNHAHDNNYSTTQDRQRELRRTAKSESRREPGSRTLRAVPEVFARLLRDFVSAFFLVILSNNGRPSQQKRRRPPQRAQSTLQLCPYVLPKVRTMKVLVLMASYAGLCATSERNFSICGFFSRCRLRAGLQGREKGLSRRLLCVPEITQSAILFGDPDWRH
jgi:hypothetical protein